MNLVLLLALSQPRCQEEFVVMKILNLHTLITKFDFMQKLTLGIIIVIIHLLVFKLSNLRYCQVSFQYSWHYLKCSYQVARLYFHSCQFHQYLLFKKVDHQSSLIHLIKDLFFQKEGLIQAGAFITAYFCKEYLLERIIVLIQSQL